MLKDEMLRNVLIILPIVAVYIVTVITLIHIVRHPRYKVGTMGIWLLVTMLIPLAGPILYICIGKDEKTK